MYADLFGIYFDRRPSKPWDTIWRERTPEEWRALAQRYGFEYVMPPAPVPLQLPLALEGGEARLYRVK